MSLSRIALTVVFSAFSCLGARAQLNDTCAQATPLTTGLNGPFDSYESYSAIHPSWNGQDPDWYRVTVQPGQEIRVTIAVTGFSGQPGILITGPFVGPCPGSPLSDLWGSGQLVWSNTTTQALDYYLLSYAFVYVEGQYSVSYTLDVEIGFSPGCTGATDDRFEVGPGIPVPIAPGTHTGLFASSANTDEYTLRVPAGTTLRAQIDFPPAQGDLDLEILDGPTTLISNGVTGQESIVHATTTTTAFHDVVVRVAPKVGLSEICNTYDLRIDVLQPALGTNYCLAGVNSYGTEARILPAGSSSVAANSLSFVCQAFPSANTGILVASTNQAQVPFGDGFRCVGPGVVRLAATAASQGVAVYTVNLAQGSGTAITPGSTWNFQAFYRDNALPGGSGFNLTDAVSIPMTP